MITEDYFLRMINQLAVVLASVLKQMKLKRYDEAIKEVEASSKQLLGLNLRLLTTLSDAEIIRLLTLSERFDVEKCVVIAELLRMTGDIREQEDRAEEARQLHTSALSLLLELPLRESGSLPREFQEAVDRLLLQLSHESLPFGLRKKLVRYYEMIGRFDKAEDILFDLVEEDGSLVAMGVEFYRRLQLKSDEELERGNLPRDELGRSLSDLQKYGVRKDS